MTRPLSSRIALVLVAFLSLAVAGVSTRYVLPDAPMIPENVAENLFVRPWLMAHAVLALVALALGPFQFIRGRSAMRPAWHRLSGRVYVAACLCSAPIGFVLAMGTSAGPVAVAGFGVLAVLWFATTALGLRAALDRRIADHRRWMIRSFALTFGAVTLRLYLPIGPILGLDFMEAYRVISWVSWVPNLIVAELIARAVVPRPTLAGAPA